MEVKAGAKGGTEAQACLGTVKMDDHSRLRLGRWGVMEVGLEQQAQNT